MKFGSLFSGIGGFDLGFERAGMDCVWQIEIDKECNRVLAKQFPSIERFDDVSKVERLPGVDVFCGGFPCQDLSVAGKREGLAGERSGLWFEFLRIVKSNLPRFVVIENVPGLYSSDGGSDFAIIVRGLVECGYCVAWRVLDSQYDGVAQRRRRVFIVGSLGNGSCAEILFESESVPWNTPTRGEAGKRVAATIRGGTDGGSTHGKPNGSDEREMIIAATLAQRGRGPTDAVMMNLQISGSVSSKWAKGTGGPAGDECYNLVTHALRSEGADASEDGTGCGTPIIAAPITASYGKQLDKGEPPNLIAFSSKDHGADAGSLAPTLRAQNFKDSHINGGGQVAIAFQEAQTSYREYENAGSLRANAPGTQPTGTLLRLPYGVRRLTPTRVRKIAGISR